MEEENGRNIDQFGKKLSDITPDTPAVRREWIAPKSIETYHIRDGAITKEKIADGAVSTEKIQDASSTPKAYGVPVADNEGKLNLWVDDVAHATEADNADKLDGYHASTTASARKVPVSDTNGLLNNWIDFSPVTLDKTNNRVGVNNASPNHTLDVNGDIEINDKTNFDVNEGDFVIKHEIAEGGDVGNCLYFSSPSQYVLVPNSSSITMTNAFSIECWFKLTQYGDPYTPRRMFQKALSGNGFFLFVSNTSQGSKIRFDLYLNWSGYELITDFTPSLNTWYHIVALWDGQYMKVYLNASLIGSHEFTGTMNDTADLYMGMNGEGWMGYIDEVRFYLRALSETEIQYNYNSGLGRYTPYSTDSLGGWWHLDETSGLVAYDSSGNSNHGTLYPNSNPPTWVEGKVGTDITYVTKNAFKFTQDGKIEWGDENTTIYLNKEDRKYKFGRFESEEEDGNTAIAFEFDTDTQLTTEGAKLLSVKNKGVEKFAVDKEGIVIGTITDSDKVDGYHASQTPTADTVVVSENSGVINLGWLPNDLNDKSADMTDGYHASQTPTANTLVVSENSGSINLGWFPNDLTGKSADMTDGYHASQTPGANLIVVSNSSGNIDAWISKSPDSDKLDGYNSATSPTPNSIPVSDTSGYLDAWIGAHKSFVSVYLSANQSIPSGTWTKIAFNAERHDLLNEHSNGTITFAQTGYYLVVAYIVWASASWASGNTQYLRVYRNGSAGLEMDRRYVETSFTGSCCLKGAHIGQYSAGDQLELWIFQSSGSSRDVAGGTGYTYFMVARLI